MMATYTNGSHQQAQLQRLPGSQQGVALITILLIVVIATVLGISMTTEQNFAISRARTFFDQGIVHQYALGGEELARQILHKDFINKPEVDDLTEEWASRELRFDFEQGEIELQIDDMQGLFNLNGLVGEEGALAKARLTDLFNELGLDPAYVERILDWVDRDNAATALGAEDYAYLGLERPYRTANQQMIDLSELRLVWEMDSDTFDLLSNYVTVLPDPNSPINLNTAPAQVIQAVVPGLSIATAESIIAEIESNGPIQSVDEFTGNTLLGNSANGVREEGLGVQSTFFRVSVRARYQDRFGYLTSVIQRNPTDGTLRVIYRDQSKKINPLVTEITAGN